MYLDLGICYVQGQKNQLIKMSKMQIFLKMRDLGWDRSSDNDQLSKITI